MIYLAILIAAILAVWYYKNTSIDIGKKLKFFLGFLRFIAISICLLLLFNPVYSYVIKKVQKPVAVILIDNSVSMNLEQTKQKSKKQLFNKWLKPVKISYQNAGFEVKEFNFSSSINGNLQSTNLAKTLKSLQKQNILTNNSEIALLSDGWFEDSSFNYLQNFAHKINTFKIPSFEQKPDIEIISIQTNNTAFTNEQTPIVVKAKNLGVKGQTTLKIYANSKLIKTKSINLKNNEISNFEFYHTFKKAGAKIIKVKLENKNDTQPKNNILSKGILVKKDKNKLLIITDALNWDTSFLAKSVNLNPHWQASTVFYLNKKLLQKNEVITLEKALKNASVVALFNNGDLNFNAKQKQIIENFAKLNKGFLVLGKPLDFSFLGVEANYIKQNFEAELVFSPEASNYTTFEESGILKAQIPPVSYNYVKAKAGAKVLASFNNPQNSEAIIYYDKQGSKTLFMAFNGLWKVQLWEQKLSNFYQNAIKWLASSSSNKFNLKSDKSIYTAGQTAEISLKLFDETYKFIANAKVKLLIQAPNKKQNAYFIPKVNSYEYNIENLNTGKYTLTAINKDLKQQATIEFEVADTGTESLNKDVNYSLLKHISKATNGKVFENNQKFVAKSQNAEIVKKVKHIPLYRKWWIWVIFIGSFCTELFIRKKKGLL